MATLKLRLTIDVEYKIEALTEESYLRDRLDYIPGFASSEGLFTSECLATVESYDYHIEKLES